MQIRSMLTVFCLAASIVVCSAQQQTSGYNHETYMNFLHKQTNDSSYINYCVRNDIDFGANWGAYCRRTLTKDVFDEALKHVHQLADEKEYRYACDILEFLIHDRELARSLQFRKNEGAILATDQDWWSEQDLSLLHDTLNKLLPLAYENFNTFNFDVYEDFLRQCFLLNIKLDDAVVIEALHKGGLFVQQGLYRNAYRIFCLVSGALITKDFSNKRDLLEKCYHLLKLIISMDIIFDDDFFIDSYLVKSLLSELVRNGEAPEKGLRLAQDLIEVAWKAHSDFFYVTLSVLADYSKEQNFTDRAIEYEKKLLKRILKAEPFFRKGEYKYSHDFSRVLFMPADYADDVIDSLIGLVEHQASVEPKIALAREFYDVFLLKTCSDLHFVEENQEQMAAEVLRWAKKLLHEESPVFSARFDSKEDFEKIIEECQDNLNILKNGCFDRQFLLREIEKLLVISCSVSFAIKYAIWLQNAQRRDEARKVIQATYKRLIQGKCLFAADALKKYVEACPQTKELNDKFADEYLLDIYCYGVDNQKIWLQPDAFFPATC